MGAAVTGLERERGVDDWRDAWWLCGLFWLVLLLLAPVLMALGARWIRWIFRVLGVVGDGGGV